MGKTSKSKEYELPLNLESRENTPSLLRSPILQSQSTIFPNIQSIKNTELISKSNFCPANKLLSFKNVLSFPIPRLRLVDGILVMFDDELSSVLKNVVFTFLTKTSLIGVVFG